VPRISSPDATYFSAAIILSRLKPNVFVTGISSSRLPINLTTSSSCCFDPPRMPRTTQPWTINNISTFGMLSMEITPPRATESRLCWIVPTPPISMMWFHVFQLLVAGQRDDECGTSSFGKDESYQGTSPLCALNRC